MKFRALSAFFLLRMRRVIFGVLLPCVLLGGTPDVHAGPFEETVRILENSTSFHWGRDCLVWVVHYPETLVEPWVDSEAGRTGMTESERSAYRESFVSDLSIGKTEPFLFTVYAFGARPLSFAPFSEKVALVTSDGERIKPLRYDRTLDQPIAGIVQGLVFFPKQKNEDFALAVRGMGVYDERIFAFSDRETIPNGRAAEQEPQEEEIVIVELPPAPPKSAPAPKTPKAARAKPQPPAAPRTIERPRQPLPPKEPEIVVIEPEPAETQSMEEFVRTLRGDPDASKSAEKNGNEPAGESGADSAYVSREKTLRTFLDLWMSHDVDTMYSMLSASSRKALTKEAFAEELRRASDFRAALKDGYKIDWTGSERAKIVAVRRVLMIRSLVSRTLGVVREDTAWKIVWQSLE